MTKITEKDKEIIWHPFTPINQEQDLITIQSGEGVYLIAEDGRKIIDAISSWWVNIHGHCRKEIAAAISRQAYQLEQVIFANFTHAPAVNLAELLLTILPSNQSRLFFSDDGSTAVEVGLKMALQFWHNQELDRKKIIAIAGAYHGDTFGSMSVGDRSIFTAPYSPFLFEATFIDFPDGTNTEAVVRQFHDYVAKGDVAAFIFEPLLQGAGGMRTFPAPVLDRLMEVADTFDVICIADEVLTGFGRTGKYFACDHLNSNPDIICLSKGLTGGNLPMGITSCSDKIVDAYKSDDFRKTFFHGHSFTANSIACAAAYASLNLLLEEETQQHIQRINDKHRKFAEWLKKSEHINKVYHLGTMLSFEIYTPEKTSYLNAIRSKILPYFLSKNILLRPLGNVIYILPPYVITNQELDLIYTAIKQFIEEEMD